MSHGSISFPFRRPLIDFLMLQFLRKIFLLQKLFIVCRICQCFLIVWRKGNRVVWFFLWKEQCAGKTLNTFPTEFMEGELSRFVSERVAHHTISYYKVFMKLVLLATFILYVVFIAAYPTSAIMIKMTLSLIIWAVLKRRASLITLKAMTERPSMTKYLLA